MRRIRPIELVISQVCGSPAPLRVASVTTLARQGYRVGHHEMRYAHLATREVIEHDARYGRAPPECVVSVAALHSSTAPMGFGYIDSDVLRKPNTVRRHPSASRGIGRYVLDSTQAIADGVRAAIKYFSRTAHGSIIVLPHPKPFEKHLPLLVGKVVKTVQRSADRLIIGSAALTAAVAWTAVPGGPGRLQVCRGPSRRARRLPRTWSARTGRRRSPGHRRCAQPRKAAGIL